MDRKKIEKLMEKGKKKLLMDNIMRVSLTYCPVCDEEEWELFDGDDIEYESELDCWGEDHSDHYFQQDFCSYHKESRELNIILKYLDIKEENNG